MATLDAFTKYIDSANAAIAAMRIAPTAKFTRNLAKSTVIAQTNLTGIIHRAPLIEMHKLTRLLARKNQHDAAYKVQKLVRDYRSICLTECVKYFSVMDAWNQSVSDELSESDLTDGVEDYSAAALRESISVLLNIEIDARSTAIAALGVEMERRAFLRDPALTVVQMIAFGKLHNLDAADMMALRGTMDALGDSLDVQNAFDMYRKVMARDHVAQIRLAVMYG